MTEQLDLWSDVEIVDVAADYTGHGCIHGVPIMMPCEGCEREVERICAECRAAVVRGEYDQRGNKLRGPR